MCERLLANPVIETAEIPRRRRLPGDPGMTAEIGIIRFPGSNCEFDVARALSALGASTEIIWHGADTIGDVGAVVIPGGFAHGDYPRPGAIARFSPVMRAVADFAEEGGPVLGICNGFQVLTEAGLLPGALTRNVGLRFICRTVECTVESVASVLTRAGHVRRGAAAAHQPLRG